MTQPTFNIDECLHRICSQDALTFEDAFDELSPVASNFVPELLNALLQFDDSYTRGKIIELLGYTHSDLVVPSVEKELAHPDQTVRQWAYFALVEINSVPSLEVAGAYKAAHPSEFA